METNFYRSSRHIKQRIAIILALLISMFIGYSIIANKQIISLSNSLMYSISSHQQSLIDKEFDNKFHLLKNIADEITDISNTTQYVPLLENVAKANSFFRIGIADTSGYCQTNKNEKFYIGDRDYFKKSINGENYVSNMLIDRTTGNYINVYSAPIYNKKNKHIDGVVFIALRSNQFIDLLQIQIDKNKYSFIIDQKGDLIARSKLTQHFVSGNLYDHLDFFLNELSNKNYYVNTLKTSINEHKTGYIDLHNKYNEYIYYQPLSENNWYLITVINADNLQKNINNFVYLSKIMIIFFSFIFGLALLWNLYDLIKHQQKIEQIAWEDELTGGKNKLYLKEIWQHYLKKYNLQSLYFINININKFRHINEINGTNIGDLFLIAFYKTLLNNSKHNEIIVHTHSDEFLLIWNCSNQTELSHRFSEIAKKITALSVQGIFLKSSFSSGVVSLNSNITFEQAYSHSLLARKKCRENPNLKFLMFDNTLINEVLHAKKLEEDIKNAIKNEEFQAFFQPQVQSKTKKIIACEALARWVKPDGSVISPFHFIPYAEKNGLIQQIDECIFKDICKKLKILYDNNLALPISINLSRVYIEDTSYIKSLISFFEQYNLPKDLIEFEITETGLITNVESLMHTLKYINDSKFKISLDDFGTGYSSIKTLQDYDFDYLKIDKSFVDNIGSEKSNTIINYSLYIAKALHLKSIAEGVETNEQFEYLKDNGCDIIQGYYFYRPLPFKEFFQLLKNQNISL